MRAHRSPRLDSIPGSRSLLRSVAPALLLGLALTTATLADEACPTCAEIEAKLAAEVTDLEPSGPGGGSDGGGFNLLGDVYGPMFVWPTNPTKEGLEAKVIEYADLVDKCLNPNKANNGHLNWFFCRGKVCNIGHKKRTELNASSDSLATRRDKYCAEFVRPNLVEKKYYGGKCLQYGNCGEGAQVNYCQAHAAGYKHITECTSSNDHVFAVIRNDAGELCVLDRWYIHKSLGVYFCGAQVGVKDGTLVLPDGSSSDEKWYKSLTCVDPLNIAAGSTQNLNAESFDARICYCSTTCNYSNSTPSFVSVTKGNSSKPECTVGRQDGLIRKACRDNAPPGATFTLSGARCEYE